MLQRVAQAARRAGRRPEDVTVIAVGKGQPAEAMRAAYAAGIRHFAENYIQEAEPKIAALRDLGGTWHLTGHLQRNKAALALRLFDWIQTADSLSLLERLDRLAEKPVPVLIEVHLGDEPTKSGVSPAELPKLVEASRRLPKVQVHGLMTIPPPGEPRRWFAQLRDLAASSGAGPVLSMGMSDDFEAAIEEGSTWVRIGRAIYGGR